MYSPDLLTLRRLKTPVTDQWREDHDLLNKIGWSKTRKIDLGDEVYVATAEPSHYHTPLMGTQHVHWFLTESDFLSWENLLNDRGGSLSWIDKHTDEEIQTNPETLTYMMQGFGFIPKREKWQEDVITHTTATIKHPHLHMLTKDVPDWWPTDEFVSQGEPGFNKLLEIQSDYCMDVIHQYLAAELIGFGTPVELINRLGVSNVKLEVPHTVYAFDRISDAILASEELMTRQSIAAIWPQIITASQTWCPESSPFKIKVRIPHKLSVMHVKPNQTMTRRLSLNQQYNTLTFIGPNPSFSYWVTDGYSAIRDTPICS